MKTIQEVLTLSTTYLTERGIPSARRQAEELVSYCLGINRLDLYLKFDYPLQETELVALREALKRRGKREPLQYIQGQVEFFDAVFEVNPNVLIPRQETEILVSRVSEYLKNEDSIEGKVLWDLCCGSGCIGISLKKAFPTLKVVLSDISLEALAVAQKNAQLNEVDVEFLQGDFLTPMQGRQIDIVICNPPYVSLEEYPDLEPEVREYEPKLALVGNNAGLEFYEKLAAELHLYLTSSGKVWLEIGAHQGASIKKIFEDTGQWQRVELIKDWAGLDRFFFLEKH